MMVENPVLTRPCDGRTKSLRTLNGKRIAVVILRDRIQSVLCGIARYVQISQDFLLQVRVGSDQQPGAPVFEIKESDWSGDIVPDNDYGCDYQVRLDAVG